MIKENIVLPASILTDDRHFTYQERMFVYFWASRNLSHDFTFTLVQYANFRGFPLQSCTSNLRAILKRLKARELLVYSIKKEHVFVTMDKSFKLDLNGSSIYINKNEINSLPSVISLRIFEMLSCLDVTSFNVTMPIEHFKHKIGIKPAMYGSNISFYNKLVKHSLKKISEHTKIKVNSELEGDKLTLYVLSST